MTPDQLDAWRVAMGFNHDQAAAAVGVGRRTWSDYVKGRSPVPRTVALACAAVWYDADEDALRVRLEAELSDHGGKRR